jgi:hypothetical protein
MGPPQLAISGTYYPIWKNTIESLHKLIRPVNSSKTCKLRVAFWRLIQLIEAILTLLVDENMVLVHSAVLEFAEQREELIRKLFVYLQLDTCEEDKRLLFDLFFGVLPNHPETALLKAQLTMTHDFAREAVGYFPDNCKVAIFSPDLFQSFNVSPSRVIDHNTKDRLSQITNQLPPPTEAQATLFNTLWHYLWAAVFVLYVGAPVIALFIDVSAMLEHVDLWSGIHLSQDMLGIGLSCVVLEAPYCLYRGQPQHHFWEVHPMDRFIEDFTSVIVDFPNAI